MKLILSTALLFAIHMSLNAQIVKQTPQVLSKPVSCKLSGTALKERNQLMKTHIKPFEKNSMETEHGYAISFPFSNELLQRISGFISLERQCCSFLDYAIVLPADKEEIVVQVSDKDGSNKALIKGCWQLE